MIINKELGLNFNENPWQGSFVINRRTGRVEEAVCTEFEAISERGGVLGTMHSLYQRGKIREESLYPDHKKHDGSLPPMDVNMFLPKEHDGEVVNEIDLIRSTQEEEGSRLRTCTADRAVATARRLGGVAWMAQAGRPGLPAECRAST